MVIMPRNDLFLLAGGMVADLSDVFKVVQKSGRAVKVRNAQQAEDFVVCFDRITRALATLHPNVKLLEPQVGRFDFDPKIPGNGFRSLLACVDTCLLHILRLTYRIKKERSSMTFKAGFYSKELEAFSKALAALSDCMLYAITLMFELDDSLFPDPFHPVVADIFSAIDFIDQEAFYGRCVGFQVRF